GFPGAAINAIGGRSFVKSIVEWNLPPWRFRRAGIPALFATWARPAVFAGALATDLDGSPSRQLAGNLGGQIDFRIEALSALELTLSVGAAVAFQQDRTPRGEAMTSLKVLR